MWHINRRVGYITKGIGFMMFTGIATTGTDGLVTVYFPRPLRRIRPVHIIPMTTTFYHLMVASITTTYFVARAVRIYTTTDGSHSHSITSSGAHTHVMSIATGGSHTHPTTVTSTIAAHSHTLGTATRASTVASVSYSSGSFCDCGCWATYTGGRVVSYSLLTVAHGDHLHTSDTREHRHWFMAPSSGDHSHGVSISTTSTSHTHSTYSAGSHSHGILYTSTSISFYWFVIF